MVIYIIIFHLLLYLYHQNFLNVSNDNHQINLFEIKKLGRNCFKLYYLILFIQIYLQSIYFIQNLLIKVLQNSQTIFIFYLNNYIFNYYIFYFTLFFIIKITILCENCTSNPKPAIAFCIDCKANLCKDCLQVIHSNRLFQSHQTTKPFKTIKCSKHNNFCTCFCAKCQQLCCQTCIEEDHQGHVIQSIDKAFNIILSETQRKHVNLTEFQNHIKDINEKVTDQQYVLDSDMKQIISSVQQSFEQLNKVIQQKQLEIQSQIEQFQQSTKSSLQTAVKNSIDYLVPIMTQVDTTNSFVETQQKAYKIVEWLKSQNKLVDLDDSNNEFKDVVSRLAVELQALGRYTVDLSQLSTLCDKIKAYELQVDKMQ